MGAEPDEGAPGFPLCHVTELEADLDTARKDLLKSEDVNAKL